jgi:hypothetical protein
MLFTMAKIENECEQLLTGKWMRNIWQIYTMECYMAMKRNEIFKFEVRKKEMETIK